ncbi:CusA/CzcA family heavy metal efflux RND transporter [Prolixibacter sp. SD074]|uniref:CusA/CzcA family heavy metal efflux RND transporter n=1 Tax=Prolixibacter sp. SD074 TaxID=2652391 RepID=UPI0012761661|nr:CusA/CzcA family heavy metal efflux RND transporter [Prolixibacter sp. SD074]GET29126.1 acriflavine resistance protein B [Prolixibacter sp. SD074]
MLDRIIEFSIRNKLVIGLLTLALIGLGIFNFTRLPIDAVPDITNNQVQVTTVSPSLAPQEVEQFITFPIEVVMANIQGVKEIRSISRFGLSVVTIVFEDRIDTHIARQMVSEQIKRAEQDIPAGYGTPEMMPITTGLGEIFQYVLVPEKGYEKAFNPMKIRTVQDWIVKRQLSGIPGIVEISSFGGEVKQYEVAVKPRDLVGMNVTITEIYNALVRNNENTGGSYIEKGPHRYYIRAEGLVRDEKDIGNILIKNVNGYPLFIKDVAVVKLSSPPRFGAMTKDGKGETVGGITLMLKGANTSQVIKEVRKRIDLVQKSLPEGLIIEPYLDRSQFIAKTINTVKQNLLEGGIIVIFILILLLGNYRSGLIVASVIPLSMLFAFIMMNIFGVTANLMSLGAIDFGLIVDGAVIVVEGIVYLLHQRFNGKILKAAEMDDTVSTATHRVGRSAAFGVIIILIVYLPILAFTGIEGKNFKPMAQTVSFALLGALILSLTYVPMISAVFLSRKVKEGHSLADRIIDFLSRSHRPVLKWALRHKFMVLLVTIVLFVATMFSFSRLGGEFMPTLEEGDLACQMTIAPGASLGQSIKTTTQVEKILMKQFPEVKTVVSKIGTAEIPTDPMAVEDADIMIIMKDKKEWVSADNREELVAKMKKALDVIPGASFDFSQPIQLRFNELMTGVKADVAVKIYGEDMNLLFEKANEAATIIQGVQGAGDVRVEQVTGLPQMMVRFDRDKLAHYNLDITDVNNVIRTGFAGEKAGLVFEGERRFDLVIRLDEAYRKDIRALERLRINKPDGKLILLNQVATVTMENGPMQISRDNTHRRIVIGINVRNRDVESFVNDINNKLQSEVKLPPGYYFSYGGQFENLQSAKKSSSIAVPVALVLIFIMLYFAFSSLKQATMIFTAIPLAVMGGVWTLFMRGMPFSISAGVGFIALFGIVVLNGIVLISYYNQLEQEGVADIYERVLKGTSMRLRPVLLTASTDALGFLPMAVSTAAGAEVQRPLATVVIGGLITSTFLTLVVLPVIYYLFHSGEWKNLFKWKKKPVATAVLLLLLFPVGKSWAQGPARTVTLGQAVEMVLNNNLSVKARSLMVEREQALKKSSFSLDPVMLQYDKGKINTNYNDYNFQVRQRFEFPTMYGANARLANENIRQSELALGKEKSMLTTQVKMLYSRSQIAGEKLRLLRRRDSLFGAMEKAADRQLESGAIGLSEYNLLKAEALRYRQELLTGQAAFETHLGQLQVFLYSEERIMPVSGELEHFQPVRLLPDTTSNSWDYRMMLQDVARKNAEVKLSRNNWAPAFSVGYFDQSFDGNKGYDGWSVGLEIPIWFWSQTSKTKALKLERESLTYQAAQQQQQDWALQKQLIMQQQQLSKSLDMYESEIVPRARELLKAAIKSREVGQTDYIGFSRMAGEAFLSRFNYLDILQQYNETVLQLNLVMGSPETK